MDNSDIIGAVGNQNYQNAVNQGFSDDQLRQALQSVGKLKPQTPSNPVGDIVGGIANTFGNTFRNIPALATQLPAIGSAAKYLINPSAENAKSAGSFDSSQAPFLTDEQRNAYKTGGGEAAKSIAGQAAGTASFIAPELQLLKAGAGAGTLAKIGSGILNKSATGAVQGTLAGVAQPNADTNSVTGSAEAGALLGPLGSALSKGVGKLSGTSSKAAGATPGAVDSLDNTLLSKQWNIPQRGSLPAVLKQTVANLNNNYGVRSGNEISALANIGTGDTGALTNVRKAAVFGAGPVDLNAYTDKGGVQVPDFQTEVTNELKTNGIGVSQGTKNDISELTRSMEPANNPEAGQPATFNKGEAPPPMSTPNTFTPESTYSTMQQLGNLGSQHYQAYLRNGNTEDAKIANIALNLKNSLSDRLFQNAGADASMGPQQAAEVARLRSSGVKGASELADKLEQAKTLNEVNALHGDLINGQKIVDADQGQMGNLGKALTKGMLTAGGFLTHGPLGGIVASMAAPAVEAVGSKLEKPILRGMAGLVGNGASAADAAPAAQTTGILPAIDSAVGRFIPHPTEQAQGVGKLVGGSSLAGAENNLSPATAPESNNPNNNSGAQAATLEQQANDWYAQASAAAFGSPSLQNLVDSMYQSRLKNIKSQELSSATNDVITRINKSPTGILSTGPIDWLRQRNDPNYAALVADMATVDKLANDLNVPGLDIMGSADANTVKSKLHQLQSIISGAPAGGQ